MTREDAEHLARVKALRETGAAPRWDRPRIEEALAELERRLDRTVSGVEYQDRCPAWEQELGLELPCFRTIVLHHGSWNNARRRAGLPVAEASYDRAMAYPEALDTGACVDAVVRASRFLGRLPTLSEYTALRKLARGEAPTWPSAASIRGHLQGWGDALERAAAALEQESSQAV